MEMTGRQKELVEKLHEHFMEKMGVDVATWDDMYSLLRDVHNQFCHCNCPLHGTYAMSLSRAFIVAMEELPEEGDIVKIYSHMADLLFYHAEEKLGMGALGSLATARGLSEEDAEDMLEALLERKNAEGSTELVPVEQGSFARSGKKVLH